jgi:RNA polymerase sigma factor (sigma-70 family)
VKPPFESVVTGHGATVLGVVRAVLGHSDADDAWSGTFLAAMKAYPDLPADTNVEAWLVTIAHRKAIDVIRATARRPMPVPETPDRPSRADGGPSDLTEAVAALPVKQRQAVAYHYLAGLPYAELAAAGPGSADRSVGPRRIWVTQPTQPESQVSCHISRQKGPRWQQPTVLTMS